MVQINQGLPAFYQAAMASGSAAVKHGAGDVLIFQSRPHQSRGLLPVAHQFTSRTNNRWYNVFTPKAVSRSIADNQRKALVDAGILNDLRYRQLLEAASFSNERNNHE